MVGTNSEIQNQTQVSFQPHSSYNSNKQQVSNNLIQIMIVDINNPHSKCISLFLVSLRYYIVIYMACAIFSVPHQHNFSSCHSTIDTLKSTSAILSKIMIAITAIFLIYFYCNWRFPRVEFYIYYIIHFVICCLLAIRGVVYLGAENQGCYDGIALTQTILISAIIMNIAGVFILVMPLELAMKCLNSGGSLFWAAFWLLNRGTSLKCSLGIDTPDIVSLVHLIFFVISSITFLIVKYSTKTYVTAKCWRWVVFISWIAMIGCYISILISDTFGDSPNIECTFRFYFMKLYLYYGWIQILLPLLLLMFVRLQKGDPRGLFYKNTLNAEYTARVNTALF